VDYQVGHIAVHEYFARIETDNLVGGHAAIGATDPQVFGRLTFGETLEEPWVAVGNSRRPLLIFVEQSFES
jgi:hypothetical protein